MATTMLPPPELLPDVLPTDRLTKTGKPAPAVREELRRIPNLANAWSVVFCWVQIIGVDYLAVRLNHPVTWVIAFLLAGRQFALLNILGHEAAHRLLFSKKSINDRVGRWIVGYPGFTPIDQYRRGHMAHHRDEMGPEEPDTMLYAFYPITPASLRRKLTRDAIGNSGWKNFKGLLRGARKLRGRPRHPRRAGRDRARIRCPRSSVAVPDPVVRAVDDGVARAQPSRARSPSTAA